MRLSVAFLPALAPDVSSAVCVVVDVLRASSTLVTMFERGCRGVIVPPDVVTARARLTPGRLLCGEQGGLPPEGFDHGNSAAEFARLDLAGREAVFCTSNGTVALCAVAPAPRVFVGSLLNASAVARAALDAATHGGHHAVTVVCSGRYGGARFALDDAFCAGAIVERTLEAAAARGLDLDLDDAAHAAYAIYRQAVGGGDPVQGALALFRVSDSGRHLARLGLWADVEHCARLDTSAVVPQLMVNGEELVVVRDGS